MVPQRSALCKTQPPTATPSFRRCVTLSRRWFRAFRFRHVERIADWFAAADPIEHISVNMTVRVMIVVRLIDVEMQFGMVVEDPLPTRLSDPRTIQVERFEVR